MNNNTSDSPAEAECSVVGSLIILISDWALTVQQTGRDTLPKHPEVVAENVSENCTANINQITKYRPEDSSLVAKIVEWPIQEGCELLFLLNYAYPIIYSDQQKM